MQKTPLLYCKLRINRLFSRFLFFDNFGLLVYRGVPSLKMKFYNILRAYLPPENRRHIKIPVTDRLPEIIIKCTKKEKILKVW